MQLRFPLSAGAEAAPRIQENTAQSRDALGSSAASEKGLLSQYSRYVRFFFLFIALTKRLTRSNGREERLFWLIVQGIQLTMVGRGWILPTAAGMRAAACFTSWWIRNGMWHSTVFSFSLVDLSQDYSP